ncbi:MazG nucleotide pyrophosphohydrolase domain-containing protein, partial [Bacillus sp. HC-Mk]
MDIVAFQRWVEEFYEKRSWSQYNAFIRLNFLTEEVGEVSRVVRAIEIGRDRPDEE